MHQLQQAPLRLFTRMPKTLFYKCEGEWGGGGGGGSGAVDPIIKKINIVSALRVYYCFCFEFLNKAHALELIVDRGLFVCCCFLLLLFGCCFLLLRGSIYLIRLRLHTCQLHLMCRKSALDWLTLHWCRNLLCYQNRH